MSLSVLVVLGTMMVWSLIIGSFAPNQLLFGAVLGVAGVLTTKTWRISSVPMSHLPRRMAYFAVYALVLIPYDIVSSNLDLARRLIRRKVDIDPGIIRMDIGEIPPAASALVAHAITMTPGEIVVDYSADRKTIYVHLIDASRVSSRQSQLWRLYNSVLEKVFS